jgi:hypothetical protein
MTCDVCRKLIPWQEYIVLEFGLARPESKGDGRLRPLFCSWGCLIQWIEIPR